MSTDKTTVAQVSETGQGVFAADIEVNGFHILGDEPVDNGGAGLGPSPYDLLTAALAECTTMTVRWYARQQGWPLQHVATTVSHAKSAAPGQSRMTDHFVKRIELKGDGLTEVQRAKLIEIAAKCPVQRTLEGTPHIVTEGV